MAETDRTVYLNAYQPSPFLIDRTLLHLELHPTRTLVESTLHIRRNPDCTGGSEALFLNGQGLELLSLRLDGEELPPQRYELAEEGLRIEDVPETFSLTTRSVVNPQGNRALEGLYLSSGNFCTQCEPEGFRRITWYLDRPDVLSRFTTTLVAEKERFPVLLSNGNLIAQEELENGRHLATWEDPFPKPSYLYALVAGDLHCSRDSFVTASGRAVSLEFYVEPRNAHKVDYAMGALKRAMDWDEREYGREYDLDRYMVVAVDDFNMGAMENKGLNIFNSKYVLATADTATDTDFQNIEGVIGHEYFHNWTGNRVTCRDWFQLSLKEGLTVFRDQEFSADMSARALKRLEDVRLLRDHQFPEDAGPMAHPVRPDAYEEINNFYTMTVYNKGAEVIRMLHNLLGRDGFRRGTDLYFERFDGQAVTIDDFLAVMAEAGERDLVQFRRWYDQAGTPRVSVEGDFDPDAGTYRLHLCQDPGSSPEGRKNRPFHIPLRMALLDSRGNDLPLRTPDGEDLGTETVLELTDLNREWTFGGISQPPVLSLLRGFSAPVILEQKNPARALAFRMSCDRDPFNRWEAGQELALQALLHAMNPGSTDSGAAALLAESFESILNSPGDDPGLDAAVLTLPSEAQISEQLEFIDPQAVHDARQRLRLELGEGLSRQWQQKILALPVETLYRPEPSSMGRRSLRNLALRTLSHAGSEWAQEKAFEQFRQADNMTDTVGALQALLDGRGERVDEALAAFYHRWQNDALVVDKWLALQASWSAPGALGRVEALMKHPAFDADNPNRVRSLIGGFCSGNPAQFHAPDGGGYRFLAAQVLHYDRSNPQLAARLVTPLIRWRRYEPHRRELMRAQLEEIRSGGRASAGLAEILRKSLGAEGSAR